jgi:dihydroorotate dehydrogenase (NAD+) catalytic subunit
MAAAYSRLYSLLERLPETPAIALARYAFRLLPVERMADYDVPDGRLKRTIRGAYSGTGVELESPVILAAGYHEPFVLEKALKMGFAAATAKASKEPRKGNPGPKIIRTVEGVVNSVGYQNLGMRALRERLDAVRKGLPKGRIILNVSDHSIGNYCEVIGHMDPVVDAFEVNSCLNSPTGERYDFFADSRLAPDLFREVRKSTSKPVGLKVPPDAAFTKELYGSVIPAAIDNGFTFINFGNTARRRNSRLAAGEGGLSGPVLYGNMLSNVRRLAREFGGGADIIGTGGIRSPEQAYEALSSGAKAVSTMDGFSRDPFLAPRWNGGILRLYEEVRHGQEI